MPQVSYTVKGREIPGVFSEILVCFVILVYICGK
uniref:Uncharacterized protein n=1 Tax=virus sp. ct5rm7 TaxID=2827298 RepID=A0A8S5RH38_9VIRU|nr:MAG TPA: hypothetical protein [virus sp. ct5rm7]